MTGVRLSLFTAVQYVAYICIEGVTVMYLSTIYSYNLFSQESQ